MLIASFALIMVVGLAMPRFQNYKEKYYIIFTSAFLILLMGLRHRTCYIDTVRYVGGFRRIENMSFMQVYESMDKDVGFWLFSKIIGDVSGFNYTVWLFVLAILYIIPIAVLIKKYSLSPLFSFLVFWALGFFFFAMTGLRQTLAFSFILISFLFLHNRNLKSFVLTIIVAALFHKTALIFLIAYPLTALPLNRITLVGYAGLAVFVNVFGRTLLSIFMIADERFAGYAGFHGANTSGLVIQLLILLFSLYFLQDEKDSEQNRMLFHLCLLGCIFQSVAIHVAEMFRISMYFSIFNIILFANAIYSTYKDSTLAIAKPATLIALCFYTIMAPSTNTEYLFFWSMP